jgi:cysteine desulfurase
MRIYLDNNATTAIHPDVLPVLESSLRDVFGNASSIHREGQTARRMIENARESVAHLIGATARDVVFTSGGTESNNAAIFGAAGRDLRCHIVTSAIEHPSVAEAVRHYDVTYIASSRDGVVAAGDVIGAVREDTKLVTVMMANNETGVVQPVEAVGAFCRERGIHFHVDAVQAAGKIPVDVEQIQCDTLALSAHKLHAPKGIGALYVRRGVAMAAHVVGGAQERRRRAGTENVPLAAAFGAAAAIAVEDRQSCLSPVMDRQDCLSSTMSQVAALRDRLESRIRESLEVTVNGAAVRRLPNTSNVTFHGADGEGIVIALDLSGVAVSTGSACSSGRVEPSPVLLAMGLTPDEARATVRFSLSRFTTPEEVERVSGLLGELVPRCVRT